MVWDSWTQAALDRRCSPAREKEVIGHDVSLQSTKSGNPRRCGRVANRFRPPGFLSVATAVDHCLKVSAAQMTSRLAERLDPLICAEPVAADYLIVFAPQRAAVTLPLRPLGDGEDRREAGHRGPQPSLFAILAPRCLVDINHLGLMDRSRKFVVRGYKGDGRLPFQLGDHPGGN